MRYVQFIYRNGATAQGTTYPNLCEFSVDLLPAGFTSTVTVANTKIPVVGTSTPATDGFTPVIVGGVDTPSAPTLSYPASVSPAGALAVVGLGTSIAAGNYVLVAQRGGGTGTLTNVTEATATTQLAASATGRRGFIVYNDTANVLLLKFRATASATSFTLKVAAGASWHMPDPMYTGLIHAISAGTGGTRRVTTR